MSVQLGLFLILNCGDSVATFKIVDTCVHFLNC